MIKKKFKTNNIRNVRTERGATSLYVVIFTTLLLGIITLSFIRIIISEASQTSNTDLSQSAYDSALAGVEDAKVALLNYHQCLSSGAGTVNGQTCAQVISTMQKGIAEESCDVVRDTLGRESSDTSSEVVIQESVTGEGGNNSSELSQAYTCVKVAEELDDYRSTLSNNTRVRIVPLRSDYVNNVNSIKIRWYSDINYASSNRLNMISDNPNSSTHNLPSQNKNNPYTPPVLSVEFFQADESFSLRELYTSDGSINTDRASAFLYPTSSSGYNTISRADFAATNDKTPASNHVFPITCNGLNNNNANDREFACEAIINLPRPTKGGARNIGSTFLRIALPYGLPTTDFSVSLYTGDNGGGNLVRFSGVQARIDSTGRANDLYRRIETRVELVDIYYPYPEFTIQAEGTSGDAIRKNFYITQNCWNSSITGDTSGCSQNSSVADTTLSNIYSFFGY